MLGTDFLKNFNQSELLKKLNLKQKGQLFEMLDYTAEKISCYFNIEKKDLFEGEFGLPRQLGYNRIIKGNKKIFGHKNSSLTASLLEVPYERILFSYHRIEVLKDVYDLEGRTIREVLKLVA